MFSYQAQRLKATDSDPWAVIQQEHQRQEQHIELIAGKNHATPPAMAAPGSPDAALPGLQLTADRRSTNLHIED